MKNANEYKGAGFPAPSEEQRIEAKRFWPTDWDKDRGVWRLKIAGFFLADADTPEEAFRLGRLALASYMQLPPDQIPQRFTHDFVHMISQCYRSHYADHSKRSEARFWWMLEEMKILVRDYAARKLTKNNNK